MADDSARSWRGAAAVLVGACIPADEKTPAAWPVCAALLPHVQAVLPDDSDGVWRIASYLGNSGSYSAARDLFERNARARQAVRGQDHASTLSARIEVALWTGEAGDAVAARQIYSTLVRDAEQVLGAEHRITLVCHHQFARWTAQVGEIALAREMCVALLPVQVRVLGAEHQDTLTTRGSVAFWTGEAGDAAEARDLSPRSCPSASVSWAPSSRTP
jgi:hypothetical protein